MKEKLIKLMEAVIRHEDTTLKTFFGYDPLDKETTYVTRSLVTNGSQCTWHFNSLGKTYRSSSNYKTDGVRPVGDGWVKATVFKDVDDDLHCYGYNRLSVNFKEGEPPLSLYSELVLANKTTEKFRLRHKFWPVKRPFELTTMEWKEVFKISMGTNVMEITKEEARALFDLFRDEHDGRNERKDLKALEDRLKIYSK